MNLSLVKILHTTYDDPWNPWLAGGGALRTYQISQRLVARHEITILTGRYPGAPDVEERDGIRFLRVGSPQSYAVSRLAFGLAASTHLMRADYDLWVYGFSAFAPVFATSALIAPVGVVAGPPKGITLTIWQDSAKMLSNRLSLMLNNGLLGFLLVFVVLALFLELRLAVWVSLGIPISFFGAIALMPGLDVSVNVLSMFGFVLVLGIVVDDAIIVGENIYRHQEEHGDGMRASIEGGYEIAKPVVFAVLTTVAAFAPLLFVPGMMGKIFRVIPLVVIPCLLFSLVECLQILPAHLAHIPKRKRPGPWRRFQSLFSNGLKRFIQEVYQPFLEIALRWRYLTAAVGVATMVITIGLVASGRPVFRFFPNIEADFMAASVTMPQGTPATATSSWKLANPCTTAAALVPCAAASTIRTMGQPVRRDTSAVEPVPSGAPSNSPITPSPMTSSASDAARQASAANVSERKAQASRLTDAQPQAAAWNPGSM